MNNSKGCGGVMRMAPAGLITGEPEEALAISIFCALCHEDDFAAGVLAAVNHSGDSDSNGAITGNILGCRLGASAIPDKWIDRLELADLTQTMAVDLFIGFRDDRAWQDRYPGNEPGCRE